MISWLVEQIPELHPLYEDHLGFDKELLPYVLFEGDFTTWFCQQVRRDEDQEAARKFALCVGDETKRELQEELLVRDDR